MDTKIIFDALIKGLKNRHGEEFFKNNRNNYVFRLACAGNRYGIPQNDFLRLATIAFQESGFTISEIRATTESAYKKNKNEHAKYTFIYGKK